MRAEAERALLARGVSPAVPRPPVARDLRALCRDRLGHADCAPRPCAARRNRPQGPCVRRGLRHDLSDGSQGRAARASVWGLSPRARPRSRHALFQRRADGRRPRGWRKAGFAEEAAARLREAPARYPFMEQDALNAILSRRFRAAWPAIQFHGRFLPDRARRRDRPDRAAFRQRPKPWHYDLWRGEGRFARAYADWFAASPWPDWAKAPEAPPWRRGRPPRTRVRQAFARRLAAFIDRTPFLDR